MKKLLSFTIILLTTQLLSAQVIQVPADYSTIQQAIDSANNGDTILVSPGIFTENINFKGKNITVGSLFLTTHDPSYISQTIIDGNNNGSVVVFNNGESHSAVFCGFTLTHGKAVMGGGIICDASYPTLTDLIIKENSAITVYGFPGVYGGLGGGIYFSTDSLIVLHNIIIADNNATRDGGGIACNGNSVLSLVTVKGNYSKSRGGGLFCSGGNVSFDPLERCNIFSNKAFEGNDIFTCCQLHVVADTFTVDIPDAFHATPLELFTFDILHGLHSITSDDLYISPDGSDFNSGLNAAEPLRTIQGAVSFLRPANGTNAVIHLLDGKYSPNTNGELFPVILRDSLILSGTGNSTVSLDAENTEAVLRIQNISSLKIANLEITDGASGGIISDNSTVDIEDVVITSNYGGGLLCANQSTIWLSNVTISNNRSRGLGGGIKCENSTVIFDTAERCNIYFNKAETRDELYEQKGMTGDDLFTDAYMEVVVDTFTVLQPNQIIAFPTGNFSFDILNSKHLQYNSDLFVSPTGDDSNSGTSFSEPLRTIRSALAYILADSSNHHTIHLGEGTYSRSLTGEIFPVRMLPYVNLIGPSDTLAFLDAEETSSTMTIMDLNSDTIAGMTLKGGRSYFGPAIYLAYSSPVLSDLAIINHDVPSGQTNNGAIYCENSSPLLYNVKMIGNSGWQSGSYSSAIRCYWMSNAVLRHVEISDNTIAGLRAETSSLDLEDVRITGNGMDGAYFGGGTSVLKDVMIMDNVGRGISMGYGTVSLTDVVIKDNNGGGMYSSNQSVYLNNVSITNNKAEYGGGIVNDCSAIVLDSIHRCNIYNNFGVDGRDINTNTDMHVIVDTFTVLHPTGIFAFPIPSFTFDILHGVYSQVSSDLYVSPAGDDNNSGLTANDPLKTLNLASLKIIKDSNYTPVIHLLSGTYSPSASDEIFPVTIPDSVNLEGTADTSVILDAENTASVMRLSGISSSHVSGMTLTGGKGGLEIAGSSPTIDHMIITGNAQGSGIIIENSNPLLTDMKISHNPDRGIVMKNSNPVLTDMTVSHNAGRGIDISGCNTKLYRLFIHHNGGGIEGDGFYPGTTIDIKDALICYNDVGWYGGGGIYLAKCNLFMENTKLVANKARSGGGIYSWVSSSQLKNVLFLNNQASENGGGIYIDHTTMDAMKASQLTLTGNSAADGGGFGSLGPNNNIIVSNSILWNDIPNEYATLIPHFSYSDIQGGCPGTGNIDMDPLFSGDIGDSCNLSFGSPCIDAGTPDTTGLSLPLWDIIGNCRIWDGDGDGIARVDMGAYEYGSVPVAVGEDAGRRRQEAISSYPNPFSGATTIEYKLENSSEVELLVFDRLGRKVGELVKDYQVKGTHTVTWDGRDMAAGMYLLKLIAGKQTGFCKITLLR